MKPATGCWRARAAWTLGGLLLALGLLYHGQTYVDFPRPAHQRDLDLRWGEERYVYRRINPYDIFFSNTPHTDWHRFAHVYRPKDPVLGGLGSPPNYPPWYYGWATLLFWPTSFLFLKIAYTVLHVGLIAFISTWAWRQSEGRAPPWRFLLLASTLAVSSYTTCLNMGQASILITAALCLTMESERKHPLVAGLALGVASMKPSLALFQYVILLRRRRWKALFVCGAMLAAGTLACWIMLRTPPWVMIAQMFTGARLALSITGEGPIRIFADAGVNPALLTPGMMLVSFSAGWAALALRPRSLLDQFAIAAGVNRLAFHHDLHDNVILIFLLVALGRKAFDPLRPVYALGFFLVGLSLWLPGYIVFHVVWAQIFQDVAWIAGWTILVLGKEPEPGRTTPDPAA